MTDLTAQAEKCLKCKNPKCKKNCPIETPVPDIITLFQQGKIMEAGEILFRNNPLSAITAIVCPHERNCFGNCIKGIKDTPVEFFEIERYISGFYLDSVRLTPPPSNGIMVAIIGAGPAGLAMSIRLALRGFKVTLIESRSKIGGIMRYGIPEFRLPNNIIDKYYRILHDLGIRFKPNTFVGSNLTLEDMLYDGYKAIFIAVGTARPRKLGLLGETLGNVHFAIDFLKSPWAYNLGKNVVVIGAGNVALDAARMAVRTAPDSVVTMINNRSAEDMTGNQLEIKMAEIDGIKFLHELSTLRITETGVVCARVNVTETENGKEYEEDMADITTIPADTVIVAIGQGPQAAVISNTNVERNDRGLVSVDENGHTNQPGIFAAGDIVTGPKTVVEAVAFTKKVADEIEAFCLK